VKKWVNNWFRKDLKTKILSVLIAIFTWIIVSNLTNPMVSRTFNNIPVTILNEDFLEENDYTLKNALRNYVDVTIRGRQETVDKVKTTDFVATVDYSQITSVNDRALELTKLDCLKNGVVIESYTPTSIPIQLARNKIGTFEVVLENKSTMKPGYVLLNTTLSQETMQIFGEESKISSVDSIKAVLELKDLDRDTTKQVQCKVYDKAGKEIPEFGKNLTVGVKVEVAKEVPISLVTRGRLAADYIETSRLISPEKVLVRGATEAMEAVRDIKTEQVDIDTIDSNYTASVALVVPEGLELVNSPDEITVNINIEKLVVRNIEFRSNDINILNARNDATLVYEIISDRLVLQFKGRQAEVNAIRAESLRPAVDVSGLSEGTHRLQLSINVPSQAKLLQTVYADVKISKTPEVEKPSDETAEP
jgi:YbbR domain-containing protein